MHYSKYSKYYKIYIYINEMILYEELLTTETNVFTLIGHYMMYLHA